MNTLTSYVMVLLTVLFTVYGQLVLKWRVLVAGLPPADTFGKLKFYFVLLSNPWILSAFAAAFAAALCWMTAMMKLDLNKAYPFMALNFILVGFLAVPMFGESMTWPKIGGLALVVAGLLLTSQG